MSRFLSFALSAALLGCPGGSIMMDAGPIDEASISCQTDPLAMTFTMGMQKPGDMGLLTFVLTNSDPAPPARGNDTWTIRIERNGQPQTGATVSVVPFMPKHGHGTSVVPVVTPMGDAYSIAPLYFFMPGLWRVTLTATVAGVTDSAQFFFCIEG